MGTDVKTIKSFKPVKKFKFYIFYFFALLGRAQAAIPPNLYSLTFLMLMNIIAWGPQVIFAESRIKVLIDGKSLLVAQCWMQYWAAPRRQ